MIYWSLLFITLGITLTNTNREQKGNCCDEEEDPKTIQVKQKKFYLYQQKVNWFQANELCLLDGKRLASISNWHENNQIKALLKKNGSPHDVWLSGSDLSHNGSFTWMSTGQPFTFTDWREAVWYIDVHCVQMFKFNEKESEDYHWLKYMCGHQYFYVCESY